jgi:CubicO group peptidase (beta-lactamase class C family)
LSPSASPLRKDAVLKIASATKLTSSIALLQCVDKGLIDLDEPITKILPELSNKGILVSSDSAPGFATIPSRVAITARHLLSHTSGLGYYFLHPLLMKWRASPEGKRHEGTLVMAEKYDTPLIYEPGEGWAYGSGLDWAGIAVRRLHGGISFEDYMIENIWKPLGLSAPFPTFAISQSPEYNARLFQAAERTADGKLQSFEFWQGDNPIDQEGGAGLVCTAKDLTAVLADLISDSPKLLKPETIDMMFTPQIPPGSPGIDMLIGLQPAWEVVAGPVQPETVNHGLGGILLLGDAPDIGQPKDILAWGGASNVIWFACKKLGVAGLFATQISPFGDQVTKELINAWKKDFWTQFKAENQT